MLFPDTVNHDLELYSIAFKNPSEGQPIILFNPTTMIDISPKQECIIGRKHEMFKTIYYLLRGFHVNICGIRGTGKTYLAKEIAYYLSIRNRFKGGFFYFDLFNNNSIDSLKERFKEEQVMQTIEDVRIKFNIKELKEKRQR